MNPMPQAIVQEHALMAELQDELLTAVTDLDRLQGLLADAAVQLAERFAGADAGLARAGAVQAGAAIEQVRAELGGALVALQFQDLATQLLSHATARIHAVADVLAIRAMPADDEAAAPVTTFDARPCPVAQRHMEAGSVELF